MPQIAELKVIDGATWCRVEIKGDDGWIGIYTPAEVDAIRKDERNACAALMDDQRVALEIAEIEKSKPGAGVLYNPEQTLWKKAAALIRAQNL